MHGLKIQFVLLYVKICCPKAGSFKLKNTIVKKVWLPEDQVIFGTRKYIYTMLYTTAQPLK